MTDFILSDWSKYKGYDSIDYRIFAYNKTVVIENYANFLKQPLTLGMFVPCDQNGNVLKEPMENDFYYSDGVLNHVDYSAEFEQYQKAKEKVLFKDCTVKGIKKSHSLDIDYFVVYHKGRQIWISWTDRVIDDFILNRNYLNGLELTESAIKQIGL